jgi:hypothetical protein
MIPSIPSKSNDVPEEYVPSIFRIEEQTKRGGREQHAEGSKKMDAICPSETSSTFILKHLVSVDSS